MKTVHFVSFSETEEVILNLGLVTLINVPVPDATASICASSFKMDSSPAYACGQASLTSPCFDVIR